MVKNADRFIRVRDVRKSVRNITADDPSELAVFLFDFREERTEADYVDGSGCDGLVARRIKHPCGSSADEADRRKLRGELLRLVAEDGAAGVHAPP